MNEKTSYDIIYLKRKENMKKRIEILNARSYSDLSKYDFDNLCAIIPINNTIQIIKKIMIEN